MPRPFCVVSDSCYNGSRIGSKNELISDTGSAGVQIQSPAGAFVFDAERLAEGHYEIQMDRDRT